MVFANEYFKPFLDAYCYSRQQMGRSLPAYGISNEDITNLLEDNDLNDDLGKKINTSLKNADFVGFIGGPPCPDFSIAGKNRGHAGENGRLSQTYIDLICRHKPDFFLFENVKGLYRTKKHREFFEKIKNQLHEAGYQCTEKLINSLEYGAPQDRERIILIGFKKDSQVKKRIEDFHWSATTQYSSENIYALSWPKEDPPVLDRAKPPAIEKNLTVQHWFEKNDVTNHPNALHAFTPRAGLPRFKETYEGDVTRKSYKRLHRWRYSPTAAYGNNEVHIHPYLARRISAAEALAIQSLPKEFCLPPYMTLSNMFKTIGNGVPYLASKGIAENIMSFLSEESCSETNSKQSGQLH